MQNDFPCLTFCCCKAGEKCDVGSVEITYLWYRSPKGGKGWDRFQIFGFFILLSALLVNRFFWVQQSHSSHFSCIQTASFSLWRVSECVSLLLVSFIMLTTDSKNLLSWSKMFRWHLCGCLNTRISRSINWQDIAGRWTPQGRCKAVDWSSWLLLFSLSETWVCVDSFALSRPR